jgi:hypothetical protein
MRLQLARTPASYKGAVIGCFYFVVLLLNKILVRKILVSMMQLVQLNKEINTSFRRRYALLPFQKLKK